MNRGSIPALTSLRFFAALLVLIYHYGINMPAPVWPYGVSHFGYEAVTFFFVLSGFILTYAHVEPRAREPFELEVTAFMAHRLARISPAYLVGLALAAPFFIASYVFHDDYSAATFVAALLLAPFALQSWYPPAALLWNAPGWSLSVELFLYACLVPLVRLTARMSNRSILIAALALVAASALSVAPPPVFSDDPWYNFRAYFPLWHLPQFILGVALGRSFISGMRWSKHTHEILLALALVTIIAMLAFLEEAPFLSSNIALAPVFGVLIFGAAGAAGPLSRVLSLRPLVLLGDASYGVYIIHGPLLKLWRVVMINGLKLDIPPLADFACYLLMVVGVSILLLIYIEKPARRWILAKTSKLDRVRPRTGGRSGVPLPG
jgi:peptidoglycan/LPS O-acetylase OafA/YrhL